MLACVDADVVVHVPHCQNERRTALALRRTQPHLVSRPSGVPQHAAKIRLAKRGDVLIGQRPTTTVARGECWRVHSPHGEVIRLWRWWRERRTIVVAACFQRLSGATGLSHSRGTGCSGGRSPFRFHDSSSRSLHLHTRARARTLALACGITWNALFFVEQSNRLQWRSQGKSTHKQTTNKRGGIFGRRSGEEGTRH